MAKATTTEIEVVTKQPGILLELSDAEAAALRTVLGNSFTSELTGSTLRPIYQALSDAKVPFDLAGDCGTYRVARAGRVA